jgi:hypothetical protein
MILYQVRDVEDSTLFPIFVWLTITLAAVMSHLSSDTYPLIHQIRRSRIRYRVYLNKQRGPQDCQKYDGTAGFSNHCMVVYFLCVLYLNIVEVNYFLYW